MNSYLTQEELDELVIQLFTSDELNSIGWSELSISDKTVYLTRAVATFESLKFSGIKYDHTQIASFPRFIRGNMVYINANIKKAIAHLVIAEIQFTNSPRLQAQAQGVQSLSASKYSETFRDNLPNHKRVDQNIINLYLRSYIFNGVIESDRG